MKKLRLGAVVGAVLGLIDGASAWAYPEARSMMAAIVVGSTVKGLATGVLAGALAMRLRSTPAGVVAGILLGWILSTLAAAGQPAHYWAIVLPGMLVGAMTGYVTQRYPAESRAAAAPKNTTAVLLAVAAALSASSGSAQTPSESPLLPLEFLIGEWEGPSEGQPGSGTVQREYTRILGGRFIQLRNVVVYPPQEKNPKGETHEDIGTFSFDRGRKRLVFRQFHIEGFVTQYVAEPPGGEGPLVFTSEAIENIPAGWRARETFTVIGPDEIEERFELAQPEREFELYSRARLKRVRR